MPRVKMMKKILSLAILVAGLTSCHMEADEYSDQQIFYGEPLVKIEKNIENKAPNNGFIYDPEKSDCYDCEDEYYEVY